MSASRYTIPGQYRYHGIIYNENVYPKHHLDRIRENFKLREDDILIAAYPKSGNTWMNEIVWLLMNDLDLEMANSVSLLTRVPYLERYVKVAGDQTAVDYLENQPSPRIIKTHLPYSFLFKEPSSPKLKTKIIFGVRNIKDTLVSFYHFYRMNSNLGNMSRPFADFFELFKEKELTFGDWFDYVLGYWNNREQHDFHLLKYEDLHRDFAGTVRDLAAFLGKEMTEDGIKRVRDHVDFDKMKDNVQVNHEGDLQMKQEISSFMRKGEVGDWRNYLTEEQNEYIDELISAKMEGTGLALECGGPC